MSVLLEFGYKFNLKYMSNRITRIHLDIAIPTLEGSFLFKRMMQSVLLEFGYNNRAFA